MAQASDNIGYGFDEASVECRNSKNLKKMRLEPIIRWAPVLERTNLGAILKEERGGEDKVGTAGQT